MTQLEINKRCPYQRFNWSEHTARTSHLSLEERGMFDLVRGVLWTVVGCRMPLATVKARLRIAPGDPKEALLETLLGLELLRVDDDSMLYDEVQAHEFALMLAQATTNAANGRKGGRPRGS